MPFTPLHLGPGAVFKAIGERRFSFLAFAGAQVLMDIEPALGLWFHWPVLHGYSHTVAGAVAIAGVAAAMGRPIGVAMWRRLALPDAPLGWSAALLGAYVGTFSHLGLDAVMHGDMRPFWPWRADNPWLGAFSLASLHLACGVSGMIGATILLLQHRLRGRL